MKFQQIVQDIQLLINHPCIENIEKKSTFQYILTFILRNPLSIYANNNWQLILFLPQNYPYSAPRLKFQTSIFHLNVSNEGWVHMGILEQEWTQMGSPYSVIDQLESILEYPDTTHSADKQILKLYINNKNLYNEKCQGHLMIKKRQVSRVDSEGKKEIEEHINDLNNMRLTKFSGYDADLKFTVPSNMENHEVHLDVQCSNIFFQEKAEINNQKQRAQIFQNFSKEINHERSKKNQFVSQNEDTLQFGMIQKQKDSMKFNKTESPQRQSKKKIMKESQLVSIAQSIRGEDNSNIWDLSTSKDERNLIDMKFSKTFGLQENNQHPRETFFQHSNQQNQKTMKNVILPFCKQSLHIAHNSNQTQIQPQYSNSNQDGSKRPDTLYKQIALKYSNKSNSLLHKVSEQLWKTIQSVCEIQRNLKSQYVVRNKQIQKVLRKKFENQLENLERLQHLQGQLKHKIISDLQNEIRVTVK